MLATDDKARWRDYCAGVPRRPGIYKFLGRGGKILYVGKAKDLRSRLNTWLLRPALNRKHLALLSHLKDVDFVTTRNEVEALLLENNLIKEHQPAYNVLLKDNKSYPLIRISEGHEFPGVYFFRGVRIKSDDYFGPYPDTPSVRRILKLIYKLFKLRQCTDAVFSSRVRPCVQYQLGNCDAPCTGLIGKESYRQSVRLCRLFLKGKRKQVATQLKKEMDEKAVALKFEEAAKCRDQLEAIRVVNTDQIAVGSSEDADYIVAGSRAGGQALAQVLSIRGGINLGVASKKLKASLEDSEPELTRLFVMQHYRRQEPPPKVVTEFTIDDAVGISGLLACYHPKMEHKVQIFSGQENPEKYQRWLQMARSNLTEKLSVLEVKASLYTQAFTQLSQYLPLGENPRMDSMDVSHLMGQNTVCSSVCCDSSGPRRDLYRLYNLEPASAGDDLAALSEALRRKLRRIIDNQEEVPTVLLIDGGVNQWRACHKVLAETVLDGKIHLLSISKHENRKLGMEYLHFDDRRWIAVRQLPMALFRCLLTVRNEAHRFAINAHRERRRKRAVLSRLDGIPSVGAGRRQALLSFFRDAKAVQYASVEELSRVPGISHKIAALIFSHFHPDPAFPRADETVE
ncbi:MAG: excinuclease ABC subunit UvrC [Proteobacteria bacterium]|nr:excinuclease ABC subunit UvrC [Pseudomonadota bacterium]